MKTIFNNSNYGNDLSLTKQDAINCSHSGECLEDIKRVMQKKYIKKQLKQLNPDSLKKELSDYGAWNDTELNNHNENLIHWVWISAGDISENLNN